MGLGERLLLEGVGVLQGRVGGQRVPLHVEFGGGKKLGHVVALVERGSFVELCSQILRHGSVGLIMLCIVAEDFGMGGPVLVELGGELDKVARSGCAGEAGVLNVGEHAVKSMAEFVEEGGDLVEGDERGVARGRLGEVTDVGDDRGGVEQARLADEAGHPCAALFVVALKVVAIDQREVRCIGVEDLEDADVGVVDGKIVPLLEGDAVESSGGVEDAVDGGRC